MLYGRDRKPWEGEESEGEVARGAVPVRHGIPKGFLEEVDVLKGQEKGSRIQRKRDIPRKLKLRGQSLTRDEEDGELSGAGQREKASCTEKGFSACPRSMLLVPCATVGPGFALSGPSLVFRRPYVPERKKACVLGETPHSREGQTVTQRLTRPCVSASQ